MLYVIICSQSVTCLHAFLCELDYNVHSLDYETSVVSKAG